MRSARLARFALLTAMWLSAPSCSSKTHPPGLGSTDGDGGSAGAASLGTSGAAGQIDNSTPPPENTQGLCGNQILPIQTTRPNLFLVLDRSGSMYDSMSSDPKVVAPRKYDASVNAIHQVLLKIGHRLMYGAALFPSRGNVTSCAAGSTVDSVRVGDSVTYARNDLDGPHLAGLMRVLGSYLPEGSTPTSATLKSLTPMLTGLSGETSIILTTDGAPNCNDSLVCGISTCIANIEKGQMTNGHYCDATVNCCAANGDYGPEACIDDQASVTAIAKLHDNGIKTYVVGLPGTDVYQNVMNHMANAGGTARPQTQATDPLYYRVEDADALALALKGIVADLSISCTVTLDEAPPDWSQVNVYFDNHVVVQDPVDGWKQVDASSLELVGSSCESLKSGDVFQVQVVAGCSTVIQ